MKIKVVIADDHPIVVDGLVNLLRKSAHIDVVATYGTGAALMAGLEKQKPDVLLLDLQFPDARGSDLAAAIIPKYPGVRVLILSSVDNIYDIREVMQQGCAGYLLKNVQPEILVHAIEQVHAGKEFLEPALQEELLKSLFNPLKANIKLTQREQRLLELIATGKTSVEIADLLCLSYRTIQNNRATLYEKFQVHNTVELIKVAMQLGLVK